MRRYLDSLAWWLQVLANGAVVLGVWFAFQTILEQQRQGRLSASLAYLSSYNSAEVLTARNHIMSSWIRAKVGDLAAPLDRTVVDRIVARTVSLYEQEAGHDLRVSIVNIADSLNYAATCVAGNVCDGETLRRHLGHEGRNFYCLYGTYINSVPELRSLVTLEPGRSFFVGLSAC